MTHAIAFKLNKPAHQFAAGESTGFGIRGGVKFYNRKTKQDEWTNYELAVFAKSQAQIDYYASSLVEGAVVMASGETIGVNTFEGQNGQQITLALNNARLDYIAPPSVLRAPDAAQQAYNRGSTGGYVEPVNNAKPKSQAPAGFDSFDDDIPFN